MRRPCQAVKRFIERGEERMPDALQAHVARCAQCQRALRLESAYQRVLRAVREAPMPACELPWARVQARLAARVVAQRTPVWQRYALAGGLAAAFLVASLAWLTRAPVPTLPSDTSTEASLAASVPSPAPPRALPEIAAPEGGAPPSPAPKPVASIQPAPRLNRLTQARKPALPAIPTAQPPSFVQPTAPTQPTAQPTTPAQSDVKLQFRTPRLNPEQGERMALGAYGISPNPSEMVEAFAFGALSGAEPFTVACLPLSQYELHNGNSQVEYLPIRYGTPSLSLDSEGNADDAIICSF
ncbi:MAG: hypothetical protein ACK4RG_02185 [Fimbriimonadales bacterium]